MVATIDITFLGTGSAQPSATRNHQAIALRLGGEIWLFDCGEATQHQFQKSKLKMGKVSRIFITHMHGDHCFGLGPLLCSLSENMNPNAIESAETKTPIEIYGPSPLRSWLRTTLKSTYSNLGRSYRVHELLHKDDPEDSNQDLHTNELPGHNIRSVEGVFEDLPYTSNYKVQAAAIEHSIPSLGYVVREPDQPGKLDGLVPTIKAQSDALRDKGIKNPMSILGIIQRTNEPYVLPNGHVLHPPPMRPGRSVVILGDTRDPSRIASLIDSPSLLVHEATNALTTLDEPGTTFEQVETRALGYGHSTPQMAGAFAKRMRCKKLILTHFSARYAGDESPASLQIMEQIRQLALKEFDQRMDDVYCARDLWSFEIKID